MTAAAAEPIPEHISARAEDLPSLVEGLVAYDRLALNGGLDPVVAAATLAFGLFTFTPSRMVMTGFIAGLFIMCSREWLQPPGVVFPISAVMCAKYWLIDGCCNRIHNRC